MHCALPSALQCIPMHPNSALPNWDVLLCTRAYRDGAQCARPIPTNFRAADASRCIAHQLRGRAIGRRYRNSRDLVEDFCIFADGKASLRIDSGQRMTWRDRRVFLVSSSNSSVTLVAASLHQIRGRVMYVSAHATRPSPHSLGASSASLLVQQYRYACGLHNTHR